jgi:hypothetical protein
MTWKDLTVGQYQLIAPIIRDQDLNDLEKEAGIVGALFDLTEAEVNALPWSAFTEYRAKIEFLSSEKVPDGTFKPVSLVTPGGSRYLVNYDLPKMELARYVEINHFLSDGVKPGADIDPATDRLHLLLASICSPEGKPYNVDDHSKYAEDLREVPFIEARAVLVFFCLVYRGLLENMRGSITETIATREKIPKREAARLLGVSLAAMDGFIMSNV